MSVGHIEQFYARAMQDQELLGKLMANSESPEDFINNAVREGNSLGYAFDYAEADAWIKKQQEIKASGELSDMQLEAVAGGKDSSFNVHQVASDAIGVTRQGLGTAAHAGKAVFSQFASWMQTW